MVREGKRGNLVANKAGLETVQAHPNHGMMISPTNQGANMDINAINAMDIETLKATLLSVISGDLKVKEGSLVSSEKPGPRGPTAKVQPRLEACQALMVQMASSGVTAKDLLEAGNGQFLYTDILLVARNLIEAGTITESRHGRKATWNLTTAE